MQSAKDTFFLTLRDRIAAGNAARTVVIRGVERPAVLVEENELMSAVVPTDTFVLRWGAVAVDGNGPLPRVQMECAIRYETAGTAGTGGMDRGRALSAMDAEIAAALLLEPQTAVKMDNSVTPAAVMATNVFWGAPVMGAVETTAGRTGRTVTVAIYSYEEAGER